VDWNLEWKTVLVIGGENACSQADVLEVVDALDPRSLSRSTSGRKKHSNQDDCHRENDQQFDERERAETPP
jgi:hypothetical protein